jgi:hypothetical protein
MFVNSEGKRIGQLLDEFADLRAANLAILRATGLTEDQLDLCGTHPALGTVTLRQLLATWTAHDLSHIVQVARVLARQYAGAVGPWREYIGILRDWDGAAA